MNFLIENTGYLTNELHSMYKNKYQQNHVSFSKKIEIPENIDSCNSLLCTKQCVISHQVFGKPDVMYTENASCRSIEFHLGISDQSEYS